MRQFIRSHQADVMGVLNDDTDRRVLAWQGNSQTRYEQNLDILKQISRLPITMW